MVHPSFTEWERNGGRTVRRCPKTWVLVQLPNDRAPAIQTLHTTKEKDYILALVEEEDALARGLPCSEALSRITVTFKPYTDWSGRVINYRQVGWLVSWAEGLARIGIQPRIMSTGDNASLLVSQDQIERVWQWIRESEATGTIFE